MTKHNYNWRIALFFVNFHIGLPIGEFWMSPVVTSTSESVNVKNVPKRAFQHLYRQTSVNTINWCRKTVVLCAFVLIGVPNTC